MGAFLCSLRISAYSSFITAMNLNLFDTSSLPPGLNVHEKVSTLQWLSGERQILERWSDGFKDRDGKFVKEFQSTFHSSFFELYLFALLKAQGMTADLTRSRPDFLVTAPSPMVIEAVTANIKKGGRPEGERSFDDILSMFSPPWKSANFDDQLAESIIRYSSALCTKAKKYQESYSQLKWVTPDTPYVIAMGSFSNVNYGREYHYGILALLFGAMFDSRTRKNTKVNSINKPGTNSPIALNIFSKDEFRHVSAVLFTCTLTLGKLTSMAISEGHPSLNLVTLIRQDNEEPLFKLQEISMKSKEDLFDGLFVLHNPNATNPLPASAFAGTSAIHIRQGDGCHTFEGEGYPLVARLSLSRATTTPEVMREIGLEAFLSFNDLEPDSLLGK